MQRQTSRDAGGPGGCTFDFGYACLLFVPISGLTLVGPM